jgi:hypothetical protein
VLGSWEARCWDAALRQWLKAQAINQSNDLNNQNVPKVPNIQNDPNDPNENSQSNVLPLLTYQYIKERPLKYRRYVSASSGSKPRVKDALCKIIMPCHHSW